MFMEITLLLAHHISMVFKRHPADPMQYSSSISQHIQDLHLHLAQLEHKSLCHKDPKAPKDNILSPMIEGSDEPNE